MRKILFIGVCFFIPIKAHAVFPVKHVATIESTQTWSGGNNFVNPTTFTYVNSSTVATTFGIISTITLNGSLLYPPLRVSSVTANFTNCPTSGQFGDLLAVQFSSGVWAATGRLVFSTSSAVTTDFDWAISSTAGNSTTGFVTGDNYMLASSMGILKPAFFPGSIPNYIITVSSAANVTYYLKISCSYVSGTPQATGSFTGFKIGTAP